MPQTRFLEETGFFKLWRIEFTLSISISRSQLKLGTPSAGSADFQGKSRLKA
jgi:hypothetical protein